MAAVWKICGELSLNPTGSPNTLRQPHMAQLPTIQPMVPHTRTPGNSFSPLARCLNDRLAVKPNVGMKQIMYASKQRIMGCENCASRVAGAPALAIDGAHHSSTAPKIFKMASTFSVFNNRSATSPRDSGAKMAAIGATV